MFSRSYSDIFAVSNLQPLINNHVIRHERVNLNMLKVLNTIQISISSRKKTISINSKILNLDKRFICIDNSSAMKKLTLSENEFSEANALEFLENLEEMFSVICRKRLKYV